MCTNRHVPFGSALSPLVSRALHQGIYMCIYIGKGKSFRPSLQPMRNSGTDPDRIWRHRYSSVKPWTAFKKGLYLYGGDTNSCPGLYPKAACPDFRIGYRLGKYSHLAHMLLPVSMEPWTMIKKALPLCGSDTSSYPGPTLSSLVPIVTSVVGYIKNFSHCPLIYMYIYIYIYIYI